MERDLELRIKGHLYEIGSVNDEEIGSRQGFPPAEEGYTETLESVADVATKDELDAVASHIKEWIRTKQQRPANSDVRKEARMIVSKAGFPPDRYLNAV